MRAGFRRPASWPPVSRHPRPVKVLRPRAAARGERREASMSVRGRWPRAAVALTAMATMVTVGSPARSVASTRPMPIDHVVVVMQENRSFDSYFGQLHFEGQPKAIGEPKDASNPDPTDPGGPPIKAYHKTNYCEVADLDHSWNGAHAEY